MSTVFPPQTQDLLVDHIVRLQHDASQANRLFAVIDQELEILSRKARSGRRPLKTFAGEIQSLQSNWRKCHKNSTSPTISDKEFRTHLWTSREIAGNAQATVNDIAQVFLPLARDPSVPLQEKKRQHAEYEKLISDRQATALDMTQLFISLRISVEESVKCWSRLKEGRSYSKVLKDEKITNHVRISSEYFCDFHLSIEADGFVGRGIGFMLNLLCPVWGSLMPAGERAMTLDNADTPSQSSDGALLIAKLTAICTVWAMIRRELQEAVGSFTMLRDCPTPTGLELRLARAERLFTALSTALWQYQVDVDDGPSNDIGQSNTNMQ
ncbi:hypothetical protein EIP91_005966 [Steccherinum ochraceum]|uniref:Uncharacterized protein n=1 Tax=Steccherinum ochraceum TaxID=92696 RepID=A0A4R0RHB1_9APHY|nr:hypothetical protein EIP91_005966 [Steccherinum ochraceum]